MFAVFKCFSPSGSRLSKLLFYIEEDSVRTSESETFQNNLNLLGLRLDSGVGPGSNSGSGSFYHQAQIVRKILIPFVL